MGGLPHVGFSCSYFFMAMVQDRDIEVMKWISFDLYQKQNSTNENVVFKMLKG